MTWFILLASCLGGLAGIAVSQNIVYRVSEYGNTALEVAFAVIGFILGYVLFAFLFGMLLGVLFS